MSKREVRAFDYVNQAYEPVRDALRADAAGIIRTATKVAETRADELVAALSVDVKGIEVSKEILLHVGALREEEGPRLSRVTHVELEWQAKGSPGLFPVMKADLSVYPLSGTETQVELRGIYEPPMGALGGALDAVAGHRVAEASVHRFVSAVAERLRQLAPHK
jgi:hypothetical protein